MSDIYLQITETPTVVTLSAPVISGALSSTVTVANTVTVALDSNSLSALENVTVTVGAAITGTVTVSNFPASQTVTFSAVTISNFPASQAVSLASVPTHGVTLASTTVTISSLPAISGTVTAQTDLDASTGQPCIVLGYGTPAGMSRVTYNNAFPVQISNTTGQITPLNPLPISGTVTIGAGTAQIGSVTASGTVTIGNNITLLGNQSSGLAASVLDGAGIPVYFRTSDQNPAGGNFPISGTVTIGNTVTIAGTVTANPTGTQTIAGSVTLGAGTAQIGSVTASISGTVPISISSVTVGNSVTIGSLPALAAGTAQIGSVTASISANPSGALTTRFGSVTTANTAQITTAVTNTSRKYLFAQNISIGSVTIGIGFSPTTTQGIQLSAGSGIVFDSFCPTGAVYWLGATTGAAFTILEG